MVVLVFAVILIGGYSIGVTLRFLLMFFGRISILMDLLFERGYTTHLIRDG